MAHISFFNEETSFLPTQKVLLRQWLTQTARKEGYSVRELNYIFCSDEYVWKMNKEYLDHDTYTDILTFDTSDEEQVLIGDIFISIERVMENAEKFQVSLEDELHRVMVHGVLHLCGYGDLTEKEEIKMRQMENFYLKERPEKLRVNKK